MITNHGTAERDTANRETTAAELEGVLAAAHAARRELAATAPDVRADRLVAVADALEAEREGLVDLAGAETHLGAARLTGELRRTTFQARLFADALRSGALTPVRVDHADPDWGTGPRPDLRRTVTPVGPVLVFAASNFPFAFSTFGGDTVSALAAGCPVVVKAHPGHPRLSRRTAALVTEALRRAGAPEGTFALVEGVEASLAALRDDRVAAAAFTGSLRGGRSLFDIAAARPVPIPFYGELGSVNPVVVTPAAWEQRGAQIASGWVGSLTLGAGQFCTNPGVVLVPDAEAFLAALELPVPDPVLHAGIASAFHDAVRTLSGSPGVTAALVGEPSEEGVRVQVLRTTASAVLADPAILEVEAFGPAGLLVEYTSPEELTAVLDTVPGQLTGTVQAATGAPDPVAPTAVALLAERVGRVVHNEWPTGVTVSAAQHHGGPYPATTAPLTTSVGLEAVTRFQRPVAYQSVPQELLPPELRDRPVGPAATGVPCGSVRSAGAVG
ncbi:aldehyde dehydrogenase (NADP(+)) [Kineococcus sp. TRM81007]|uniref:aldehyde dehydrogenase (NADP(+)) n=1 Tax=Kineococcus sp. TRM81007 TaxID=2925831 RepID=UPI001F56ADDF|nr:aldehyde dehydrogenase (NADP(+)) [Kineococcus sp. TRM81007]MCI2239573.1 aldehyde dehydrogenase (NADP(+)) [Kineococcus sp. TRM81007]